MLAAFMLMSEGSDWLGVIFKSTNSCDVSDIDITLDETSQSYRISPCASSISHKQGPSDRVGQQAPIKASTRRKSKAVWMESSLCDGARGSRYWKISGLTVFLPCPTLFGNGIGLLGLPRL
jgi:hypothetical protein